MKPTINYYALVVDTDTNECFMVHRDRLTGARLSLGTDYAYAQKYVDERNAVSKQYELDKAI
jgi:hypothetical protein